jgi:hypothetical protein
VVLCDKVTCQDPHMFEQLAKEKEKEFRVL